jgi:homoserine kinase type II
MAVFTGVTEAQLGAWLADYSLGRLLEMQGIASGIENTNYFVTTSNGKFVLTLFEKLTSAELPYYLDLMSHLARHGIPCPAPVANRHNSFLGELNGKPACIVSRLVGKSEMQPAAAHCAAVGAMLGQMHLAGQSFPAQMENPRGGVWRRQAADNVRRFLKPEEQALLDSEIAFHEQHPLVALPQGVVHADLFRDNVLLDGARVGGLIDFYFACNDSLLYDVAITVNDWCVDEQGNLDPARTQALLAAYNEVRPFTAAEKDLWHIALRVAALRFWLSRLYDMHLPRDGELVRVHNPEQFKRILSGHIASGSATVAL